MSKLTEQNGSWEGGEGECLGYLLGHHLRALPRRWHPGYWLLHRHYQSTEASWGIVRKCCDPQVNVGEGGAAVCKESSSGIRGAGNSDSWEVWIGCALQAESCLRLQNKVCLKKCITKICRHFFMCQLQLHFCPIYWFPSATVCH